MSLIYITKKMNSFHIHTICCILFIIKDFPNGSVVKESICQGRTCRRRRFDSWLGRSSGEGNGNPPQYSCLRNPMDRGAWQAIVHGVTKSRTQCNYTQIHIVTSMYWRSIPVSSWCYYASPCGLLHVFLHGPLWNLMAGGLWQVSPERHKARQKQYHLLCTSQGLHSITSTAFCLLK